MNRRVGKDNEPKQFVLQRLYIYLEDTFLLLDALEDNMEEFRLTKPGFIVEVG